MAIRKQLKRIVYGSLDRDLARRALAALHLNQTVGCVSETVRRLCAARSSVRRWRALFEECRVRGLEAPVVDGSATRPVSRRWSSSSSPTAR